VRFIADVNARGMGMYYLQAEVFCMYFPCHLASLLSIHLLPILFRATGCFLRFVLLTRLHAKFSTLNSTWLGPVGDAYTISPAGSGLSLFKDNTATIYVIANTGAMLDIGQERSKEKAALTAEPHCGSDLTYPPRTPHATGFL
jgi:hypothetical protein